MIFDRLIKTTVDNINTSEDLANYLQFGGTSLSGVRVSPKQALKYAPVFSCIKVLSESVGQLPLNLHRVLPKNANEIATEHPLQQLLHYSPNELQTSQEFLEMVVAHVCLRGNFYAYINRSMTGKVYELLPLQPDAVEPSLSDDNVLTYTVTFANGTSDNLPAEKVFHVKGLSLDGYTGVSIITYARETIGLGIATGNHGARLFNNGARPGGVLSTEQKLDERQIDDIRKNWNSIHGGGDNAHKTAILQGGLKWMQIGLSSEDSQFLETRKYQRSEVAGLFRVPPHMIGDLDKATFTNIEHQGQEFVVHSLMPYIRRIELRIHKSLLTAHEKKKYFAKFNVNGFLRGDMKTRGEFYTKLGNLKSISPNEIRAFEGMNPVDGGDEMLAPLNMSNSKEESNSADEK